MGSPSTDHLRGTLELLVLRVLSGGPMHGWAIAQRLEEVSKEVLKIGQGSLYPALRRLESNGWIVADWGISELGRRARFYRLTPAGEIQLERETESWRTFVTAVSSVLDLV